MLDESVKVASSGDEIPWDDDAEGIGFFREIYNITNHYGGLAGVWGSCFSASRVIHHFSCLNGL